MRKVLMTMFVLVIGCSVTYAGISDVATGLLHHWSFDDGAASATVADSVGSNDGTLMGTALTAAGGVDGSGFVTVGASGTKYVQLADTAGLTEWTLTAWINNSTLTAAMGLASGWEADPAVWYDVRIAQFNNTKNVGLTDGPNNKNPEYGASVDGATQWTHVALTGGAVDSTLYINGVEQGVITYADVDPACSFLLSYDLLGVMGEYRTWGGQGDGVYDMDEVGIWNRQLSQSEITTVVPEPATMALLVCGGLFLRRRKQQL